MFLISIERKTKLRVKNIPKTSRVSLHAPHYSKRSARRCSQYRPNAVRSVGWLLATAPQPATVTPYPAAKKKDKQIRNDRRESLTSRIESEKKIIRQPKQTNNKRTIIPTPVTKSAGCLQSLHQQRSAEQIISSWDSSTNGRMGWRIALLQ